MGILLGMVVMAALLLPAGALLRLPGTAPAGASPEPDDDLPVGIISEDLIRRRLDALADELDRLERDPDVFAKAFHTVAARSAYDALAADVSHRPRRSLRYAGSGLDLEITTSSHAVREVLDL